MRSLFVKAVVGRIANFPFGGAVWGGCVGCRKQGFSGQYSCDITWGYVASTGKGEGGGSFTLFVFGRWQGRRLENFQQVSRNGPESCVPVSVT